MTINDRFKELRKIFGLSQEELGNKIGLSKSGISNIESGKRNVTDKHIKLICSELPINEEWLRDGVGEMFVKRDKIQVISEFAADMIKEPESFKARLFESLAKLDEKDWIAIEQIFDKLTGSKDS